MKKTKNKKFSKFNIFKSKKGLTYVELLTALALLSLIVVSFTPMLLQSYETLYTAGELTEDVYNSKQEMEQGLARRDATISVNMGLSFNLNTEKLFENIHVTGKKIVSSAKESFETAFGQGTAKVKIVSSQKVPDDRTNHDITLQTTGLEYTKVTAGKFPYTIDPQTGKSALDPKTIHVEIIAPNKNLGGGGAAGGTEGEDGATTDEAVYGGSNPNYCTIKNVKVISQTGDKQYETIDKNDGLELNDKDTNGKITINVSSGTYKDDDGNTVNFAPLDFTLSPLKVKVYYVNPRGKTATVSTYLYIEPPTLIFAGEAKNGTDYFTSAGVETITTENEITNSDGEKEIEKEATYILRAEGRAMRTSNSPFLNAYFGSPSNKGVIIRNVSWIDNDETEGLKPYYVMTGTKGAIYRMYNYTSHSSDIFKLSSFTELKSGYTDWYGKSRSAQSLVDKVYNTTDGTRVYSALWSGDSTHYFDFSSYKKSTNYGLDENGDRDNCWLTAKQSNAVNTVEGAPEYDLFGTQAEFSYYYNGYRIGYDYKFQAGRTVSYILTEHGYALRCFGFLDEVSDFKGFTAVWYPVDGNGGNVVWSKGKDKSESNANCIALFTGSPAHRHLETAFSSLRFQNFGSYDPNVQTLVNFMRTDGTATDNRENARQITNGHSDLKGQESNINLTDAVYIPSAGTKKGEVLYLGSVHAYMNLNQKDNIDTKKDYSKDVKNSWDEYDHGALTDYVIFGDDDGTGTTVHKFSSNSKSYSRDSGKDHYLQGVSASEKQAKMANKSATSASEDNRRKFFVTRVNAWRDIYMDDVYFTMGYSSNREKVYSDITFNGTNDFYRSYEHLYFQSHYGVGGVKADGNPNKTPTRACVPTGDEVDTGRAELNTYNNDYYNVWFPGEMYNLTKAVTKDGVTVAVGYAVSGSTYQWINPSQYTNTSTALGGIYNDGVMSVGIEGQNNGYLKNVLYFKDNATIDKDYLTVDHNIENDKKAYKSAFGTYGTHDRQSVQFTAVDLIVETMKTSETATTSNINYYAYYGDNTGRVFRSLVATASGSNAGDNGANVTGLKMVPYIKDLTFTGTAAAGAGSMEEITVDGNSLNTIFKNIGTIDATDDLVIITGEMADDGEESFVVGVNQVDKDGKKTWSYRLVRNCGFTSVINDAAIVGGYYYIVGDGWMAGVSIDNFRNTAVKELYTHSLTDSSVGCKSTDQTYLLWVDTYYKDSNGNKISLNMYSIAGRDTQ